MCFFHPNMTRCNLSSITVSHPLLFLFLMVLVHCKGTQGEQKTHLHFYFHELQSGPNATTIRVVNSPIKGSFFGAVGVIDDILMEGLDPSSKLIGRAQGVFAGSSLENGAIATIVELVFTDGPYNGSSLTVAGRLAFETVRERTIVGGTGAFRMARGYFQNKVVPSPQGTVIYECDAYVFY